MFRKFLAGLGVALAFAGVSVVAPAAAVADTTSQSANWTYIKWYSTASGVDFAKLVCDRDWANNWESSYPGRQHSCWQNGDVVELWVLL